jgi:hypothetical protein
MARATKKNPKDPNTTKPHSALFDGLEYDLTIQEQEFCRLFTMGGDGVTGNATECYLRAFPNNKAKRETAWVQGCRYANKDNVKAGIRHILNIIASRDVVTGLLTQFASGTGVKDADRIRATELLGKTHSMFVDRSVVEINTSVLFEEVDDDKGGAKA